MRNKGFYIWILYALVVITCLATTPTIIRLLSGFNFWGIFHSTPGEAVLAPFWLRSITCIIVVFQPVVVILILFYWHMPFKTIAKTVLVIVCSIGGFCSLFLWAVSAFLGGDLLPNAHAISHSPDRRYEAYVLDYPRFIDRNFRIVLHVSHTLTGKVVFVSPDENPRGKGRFIWSKDSMKLLFVGNNFYTRASIFGTAAKSTGIQLQTGEDLYLLYHIPSDQLWCNCNLPIFPAFTIDDIADIEFNEWIQ